MLREILAQKPSLEVRRRVEDVLHAITREGRTPEEVQLTRGLEVLEMIGSAEARKVLTELAGGAAGGDLTREAKAVLERLGRRPGEKP